MAKGLIYGDMIRFDEIAPVANLCVGIADTAAELEQAQELRYKMLILEFNDANISGTDKSEYDDICDHLIVKDLQTNQVVGTYRLLTNIKNPNQEFLCEEEFDISNLRQPGVNILELGRAVVHRDYRNGPVIKLLLHGIFEYASLHQCQYVFGTSSFHGVDATQMKHAFTYIYHHYLLPDDIQCYAKAPRVDLNLLPKDQIDMALMKEELPSLVRMYFLLGCRSGEGAYIDYSFNSIDILTVMDVKKVNGKFAEKLFGKSYQ